MLESFAKRFNLKKSFEKLLAKDAISMNSTQLVVVELKKFTQIIDLLKTLLLNFFADVSTIVEANSKKLFAASFRKSRKTTTNVDFQLRDELIYHVKKDIFKLYIFNNYK